MLGQVIVMWSSDKGICTVRMTIGMKIKNTNNKFFFKCYLWCIWELAILYYGHQLSMSDCLTENLHLCSTPFFKTIHRTVRHGLQDGKKMARTKHYGMADEYNTLILLGIKTQTVMHYQHTFSQTDTL